MSGVVFAAVVFVLMEPAAALAHRRVMHGFGWGWHRSHHRAGAKRRAANRLETNDLYPVVFAGVTVAGMAVAARTGATSVVAAGVGISAYGMVYAAVHDVCVHGRLTGGRPLLPGRWLHWVASAHALHHRTGRAPYGFLLPIVPARHRAATLALRELGTRARVENTS